MTNLATFEQAAEVCRNLNRKAADACAEQGIGHEAILAGAIYAALDIATVVTGNAANGIEILRTHLDQAEARLMEEMP